MRILSGREAAAYVTETSNRLSQGAGVEPGVKRIVNSVRKHGDRALLRDAQRFDGLAKGVPLRVSKAEINGAWRSTSSSLKSCMRTAAINIRQFCEWQKPVEWIRSSKGVSVGQLVRPLESVGCYVPGGRYPLLSTLLLTVIPAQVAGVPQIRVVSPRPAQATLAAAAFLGVREFYRVGGEHDVAALAYGTESIPRVDKIVD